MSTRKEIKAEIAMMERDAKTLRKGGDMQGARMAMKEIRKLKRKLKRLDNPNKAKPDKWL